MKDQKLYTERLQKKLRNNPELWAVPKTNISRWKKRRKNLIPSVIEWDYILNKHTKEQILAILESDSEESARLRSSSPFTGILSDIERKSIFKLYEM